MGRGEWIVGGEGESSGRTEEEETGVIIEGTVFVNNTTEGG